MLSTAESRRAVALPGGILVLGVALALGYLVTLAWAMENLSYDVWGAMVVGPVLVAISIPILARAARADRDPLMGKILFAVFAAKMVGALVRYAVTFEVYGGRADAGGYHGSGSRLAAAFWDGTWDRVLHDEVPELVGTEFMRLATGVVYVVTGPTKLGGFLVFGWLSFWGLFCFYRAFRHGVPRRRPSSLHHRPVLPSVVALLAIEHRQGSLDAVHARHRRLRGRARPHRTGRTGTSSSASGSPPRRSFVRT